MLKTICLGKVFAFCSKVRLLFRYDFTMSMSNICHQFYPLLHLGWNLAPFEVEPLWQILPTHARITNKPYPATIISQANKSKYITNVLWNFLVFAIIYSVTVAAAICQIIVISMQKSPSYNATPSEKKWP